MRNLSDEMCAREGLTVIQHPRKKRIPRPIYIAEKNGEPTTFNLMREAIDFSVSCSRSYDEFRNIMREQGYVVDLNPNRKYWTVRSFNSKKAVRMYRLGEDYGNEAIRRRIYEPGMDSWQRNADYYHEKKQVRQFEPQRIKYRGTFKKAKKHTGLIALYFHYCYLLGYLPKNKQHQPLSPEMKEAWRRLDRFSEQVRLVSRKELRTLDDVSSFIHETDASINKVSAARQQIYNKLRRCSDDDRPQLLKNRDDCTTLLKQLRKEKRVALSIIEDHPKNKENIRIEEQAIRSRYGLDQKPKYYRRSYER